MDILKAPPPRPPSTSTSTSLIVSDITKTNELYDVLIHSGGPDVYFNIDTSFINETFLNSSLYNVSNSSTTPNITTQIDEEPVSELIIMAITSMILGLMILVTVIGNVFVIAAIILERNLQNVANYLVASLAVADLFVACLVMPLGAVYEISKGWILGPELCDIWTSCDVLCCTASILHLVAIALDRYWAVTNVDYMHSRTAKRVFTMIFIIWFVSIIVSLAPQFGWKDPEYLQRIEQQKCMVSQDIAYQVFATCCTFYVPLLVILVLYWKIYQTARRRIHRRTPKLPTHPDNSQEASSSANGSSKAKKPRLKFSLPSKFRNRNKNRSGAISSLGLMDGNSTNTVNTVEYTEDSTNVNDKIKVTTFTSGDEMPTSSGEPISTVSHQVASKIIVIEGDHHNSCNNNNNLNIESPSSPNSTNNNNFNKNNDQSNQLAIKSMSLTRNASKQQQQQQQLQTDAITKSSSTQHLPTGSTPTGPPHSQLTTPIQQQKQQHNLTASTQVLNSTPNPYAQINKRKETLEAKRERKAAKTLAIITGAFVFCWLPFFIMALLLPLCATCSISETISSFFLWLGYFNSTLNPVIYTIFSPEFRQAFKRILFGQTHNKPSYYRRGKL